MSDSFDSMLITGPNQSSLVFNASNALSPPTQLPSCVEGLLPCPSLAMLVGDTGSKKTYLAMDLAVSVALGQSWLGFPVHQGPVLFIDEQTGSHALLSRFNAVLHAHQADAETPLNFTSMAGFNLREPDAVESLMRLADTLCPSLIIFDAFANLLQGASQSSLGATMAAMVRLRFMAEFYQAAVLLLHHTNRHGFFQGSAAIAASLDLILTTESSPADSLVHVHTLKSRTGDFPSFSARAHFEKQDEDQTLFRLAREETTESSESSRPAKMVVPAGITGLAFTLYSNDFFYGDEFTYKQLCDNHQGHSSGSIRNAIQQLLDEKAIVRADDGGRGKLATYTLARPSSPSQTGNI